MLAVYGAGYLAACAVIAVGGVMTPWLDALIVGLGLLCAAGLLLLRQHRAWSKPGKTARETESPGSGCFPGSGRKPAGGIQAPYPIFTPPEP